MIRAQYHFRTVGPDTHIWDVRKLVTLAEPLPIVDWLLSEISEVNEGYWTDTGAPLTCAAVLEHARLIKTADLSYPIILCAEGRVMDGMHRVMRAVELNRRTIRAKQFSETSACDYLNVPASDLEY